MALPNLPVFYRFKFVDDERYLTFDAQVYNDSLFQTLNECIDQANNGWQLPQKTTAEVTAYRDSLDVPIGTQWFNTDSGYMNVKTVQAVYDATGTLVTPGTIRELQYV